MKKLALLSLAILSILNYGSAQKDEVELKPTKVSEHVYMLEGRGGNIGLTIGEDGVAIIDNQFADLSEKIQNAILELGGGKVNYVINTHLHGDHTGGNENFSENGATIIAQQNVRERLSKEQHNELWERTTPARPKAALPVITFEKSINLYFNNNELYIFHAASGHTDGDAAIFFKDENVIHVGDNFVTYGFPFIDKYSGGTLNGMIDFNEQVLKIIDEDTKIIPGHGALSKKEDLKAFNNRLTEIRELLLNEIRAGKTVKEAIEAKPLAKYEEEWGGNFISSDNFILLTWDDLKANN